jgi:hypothetical protein
MDKWLAVKLFICLLKGTVSRDIPDLLLYKIMSKLKTIHCKKRCDYRQ